MGNKLGRRRQVVDEKYTRPQGLYQHWDIDHKKLRKLILNSKLAPCFPGDEECTSDREECPICFLCYPSLNRSRCCMKGICTECFLQMKPPHSTRPTQCPFCKTSNYAVEYHGMKTKEEKGMEQIEEQKVIEAKIRMQQQERQDEEEMMQKRQRQDDEFASSHTQCVPPVDRGPSHSRLNRDDDFDLDLEDIMVMEAIWLSIQEQGSRGQIAPGANDVSPGSPRPEHGYGSGPVAPSGGGYPSGSGALAYALAALAERQHTGRDAVVVVASASDATSPPPGEQLASDRVSGDRSPGNWIIGSPPGAETGPSAVARRAQGGWGTEERVSEMAEEAETTGCADAGYPVDAQHTDAAD